MPPLATDGPDTALARQLLAAGLLDAGTLRGLLDEVRAARAGPRPVGLGELLVARGLLRRDALEGALRGGSGAWPVAPAPAGGGRLERYTPGRELGRGGMGVVHEAVDGLTGARVALKRVTLDGDADLAARFMREAAALLRLDHHPGLVPLLDHGLDARGGWLVMPLVEGGSLAQRLARGGPLPWPEAVAVVAAVADAVAHLHGLGLLHRDLKPANVLFERDGRPLLADLGLVRDLAGAGPALTRSAVVLGTPSYMAPEQALDARAVGPKADVYALGAVLYACLTGDPPFQRASALMTLEDVVTAPPPRPRAAHPDVPAALDELCVRTLAKDPAARPATAASLAAALRALLAAPPPEAASRRGPRDRARRGRRAPVGARAAAAVAGAVGLAAAVGLAVARSRAGPPAGEVQPVASGGAASGGAVAGSAGVAGDAPDGDDWPPPLWRLGSGGPPRLERPALWRDAAGRAPAPLRGAFEDAPEALAAAFEGEAERLEPGRVRVRLDPAAARAHPEHPEHAARVGVPRVARTPDGAALSAPDDAGPASFVWGRAVFAPDRVRLASSGLVGDTRQLHLGFGAEEYAAFRLSGRNGTLALGQRMGVAPLALDRPFDLELRAGADRAVEVRLSGQPLLGLSQRLEAHEAWRPWLILGEADTTLASFEVEGRPRRPDRSALAWVELPAGAPARLEVAWRLEEGALADALGGPCALLAGPEGVDAARWTLEAEPARLVLRRGDAVVAAGPITRPQAGRLVLERAGARVRGWLVAGRGDAPPSALEAAARDPAPARAGWGSSGPALAITDVALRAAPASAPAAADALARWRSAGAALLRLVPSPDGAAQTRPGRARDLAGELERVARDLEAAPDHALAADDALALALLARVVAGDGAEAEALAHALVRRRGGEGARALVDALWTDALGEPCLLAQLTRTHGYVNRVEAFAQQEAGSRAVLALGVTGEPALRARAAHVKGLLNRAKALGARGGAPQDLLEAIAREAAPLEHVDAQLDRVAALTALGRPAEAEEARRRAEALRASQAPGPGPRAALAAALRQLAQAPQREPALRAAAEAELALPHALEAVRVLSLGRAARLQGRLDATRLLEAADGHASTVLQAAAFGQARPDELAWARYVAAAAGRGPAAAAPTGAAVEAGDLLLEAVARARAGDVAAAVALVARATAAEPFAVFVAALDPDLTACAAWTFE